MKRKIALLFLLSLLVFPHSILSQSGWFWQNPLPQGNPLFDVKFLNAETGFCVNFDNLMKTTNGGINWTLLYAGFASYNNAAYMFDQNVGIMLLDSTRAIKTTNGGVNWFYLSTFPSVNSPNLYFTNSNTGFILGREGTYYWKGAKLLRTSNGGIDWNVLISDTSYTLYELHFPALSTGYAVGSKYLGTGQNYHLKLFRTVNFGTSWDSIYNTYLLDVRCVFFINENTGFVGGRINFPGKLMKTTNGGTNWVLLDNNFGTIVNQIYFVDQNIGFLLSDNYTVYKTVNGGLNWTYSYANADIGQFYFVNSNVGFGVGLGGSVVRTTNGGVNWTKLTNSNDMWLWDVEFADANTGFAAGDDGKLFKTSNGGINWNLIQFPYQPMDGLTAIVKIDNLIWYVSSYREGKVYKTTNTGVIWDTLYTGAYGITNLDFVNVSTGFGICKSGCLVKTTNGGINWTVYTPLFGGSFNYAIDFIDAYTGYVGGSKLFKTTNGGANWDTVSLGVEFSTRAVQFININTGYIGGSNVSSGIHGMILKTTNGGVSWQARTVSDNYLDGIYFLNERTGFALSDYKVYKTTNGGDNWYQIRTCSYNSHTSVYFPDSLTGYIVGSYLTIIKTTNGGGGPIGISPISGKAPKQFFLHQNYPNPFNPISKIKYEIAKLTNVKIVIFDVLGREVATLVNEQLKPGVYEVQWDGTDYPSGVYFYKLITSNFTETKKMVLIK